MSIVNGFHIVSKCLPDCVLTEVLVLQICLPKFRRARTHPFLTRFGDVMAFFILTMFAPQQSYTDASNPRLTAKN